MKKLLILTFMIETVSGLNFKPVSYFDNGVPYSMGRVRAFDSNHDGFNELVFYGKHRLGEPFRTVFYKYSPWNRYVCADSFMGSIGILPWAIGYLDNDSLTDLVTTACSLLVFESPDFYSYPKSKVWSVPGRSDSGGYGLGQITDLDQDGKREILAERATHQGLLVEIFENVSDNRYERVWFDTSKYCSVLSSDADFDRDGRKEFFAGGVLGLPSGPSLEIYECIGDNQCQKVFEDSLTSANNYDLAIANDLDGDGKPEFIIGGNDRGAGGSWTGHLWIYEAVGDNNYEIILHDSLTNLPGDNAYFPFSYCGDVDNDGREELVWAVKNNWMIYKATGNNTFERIFTAYPEGNGRGTTHIYIWDMNKNGYLDIIESGDGRNPNFYYETWVWEIEGVKIHQPNDGEVLKPGSQFPITWEKFTPPGADSFSLFVCFDNGRNFRTIATGIPANDTLYLWNVPDSLSDSCKIMIWAYGPPNPVTGKIPAAWDFSDTVFSIRQTKVKEDTRYRIQDAGLKILQNPARKEIRLQITDGSNKDTEIKIYDVGGKKVKSFTGGSLPSSIPVNPGVYFLRFECKNRIITRKVVVIE